MQWRLRGLLGWTEPSVMHGGRTMKKHREAFVGLDTAKSKHALAVAEGERELVRTLNLYKIIVHRG